MGIVSGIAVFYWPKLQLPDSPDFKVFSDDHPFEIYDSQFKNMFWFEKTYTVSPRRSLSLKSLRRTDQKSKSFIGFGNIQATDSSCMGCYTNWRRQLFRSIVARFAAFRRRVQYVFHWVTVLAAQFLQTIQATAILSSELGIDNTSAMFHREFYSYHGKKVRFFIGHTAVPILLNFRKFYWENRENQKKLAKLKKKILKNWPCHTWPCYVGYASITPENAWLWSWDMSRFFLWLFCDELQRNNLVIILWLTRSSQHNNKIFARYGSETHIIQLCTDIMHWLLKKNFRRCLDDMSGQDRTPCCETSIFPYKPHVFDECLPQIISSLYESPRYIFIPGIAGPKFGRTNTFQSTITNKTTPLVKALVVEYESTQSYTQSYRVVSEFVSTVEEWLKQIMKTAPMGMQNAWFISDLQFFDLQQTLSKDTVIAITIAMVVSFFVLLLVTFNVLLSLYAILTVTFTIFTIVAILVLMGWKLNVLECISICSAIGLSIDFSLIYSVHYQMSGESERKSSAHASLSQMLGPTLMVALTTAFAGVFMLLSDVLAYIQLGKFLIIVMSISWLYATFFLMSLLRICGPQHQCGQFKLPTLNKSDKQMAKNHANRNNRLSTQGFATEQLLSASSSAAGELVGSESHELSSLTSNSIVKPATSLETRPINFDLAFKGKVSMKENSPTSTLTVDGDLDDVTLTY